MLHHAAPAVQPSQFDELRLPKPRLDPTHALSAFGALAGAGLAALAYAYFYEPFHLGLERLTVRIPGAAGRLPAAGLRILHLTDSHFQARARREKKKIEKVRRLTAGLEYDILVHTGDLIHRDAGMENALALLDVVPPPKLGAFAVLGNHDYTHYAMGQAVPRMWRTFDQQERKRRNGKRSPIHLLKYIWYVRNTPLDGKRTGQNDATLLTERLAARGVEVLHNRSVHLLRPELGLDIHLAGVDDVIEGRPHLHHALDGVAAGAPVILLSHNPDIVDSPQLDRVHLVIAGHTHGGQIVAPLWGPAHTQVEHLARREVSGFFRRGNTQVYVSRGIGEGIPLRFGARPQITLITVAAKKEGS